MDYRDLSINEKINAKSWVSVLLGNANLYMNTAICVSFSSDNVIKNIDCPFTGEALLFRRNWNIIIDK